MGFQNPLNFKNFILTCFFPVLGRYANGICYKYAEGSVVKGPVILSEEFKNEMSIKLAKFHSLQIEQPDVKFKTHLERLRTQFEPMIRAMAGMADQAISQIDVPPYKDFPKFSGLGEEAGRILEKLNEIGLNESEVVFSHNDLGSANIIWHEQGETSNKLSLIDFEMALNNFAVFDLSDLFIYYLGCYKESCNKQLYPDVAYRLSFLRAYLQERNRLANKIVNNVQFEAQLNWLLMATNLGSLYRILSIVSSIPMFDFMKQMQTPEICELVKDNPFHFGSIALKYYEFYQEKKDEFFKLADDYLSKK